MSELFWLGFGIGCALIVLLVVYLFQFYIKMIVNRKKIRNTLVQIRGQVEIKHDLLKEYIDINKETMNVEQYENYINKLGSYNYNNEWNVDILKDFNEYYNYHLRNFNDDLLIKRCDESELKISYIKDYYNELVYGFNEYKSSGINYFLAKVMSIEDEKLY